MRTKKQIDLEIKTLLAVANSDATHVGQVARCQAEALNWVLVKMNLEPHFYTVAIAHHIKAKIVGPVRP